MDWTVSWRTLGQRTFANTHTHPRMEHDPIEQTESNPQMQKQSAKHRNSRASSIHLKSLDQMAIWVAEAESIHIPSFNTGIRANPPRNYLSLSRYIFVCIVALWLSGLLCPIPEIALSVCDDFIAGWLALRLLLRLLLLFVAGQGERFCWIAMLARSKNIHNTTLFSANVLFTHTLTHFGRNAFQRVDLPPETDKNVN